MNSNTKMVNGTIRSKTMDLTLFLRTSKLIKLKSMIHPKCH